MSFVCSYYYFNYYCLYLRDNVHFIVIYLFAKSQPILSLYLPLAAPYLDTLYSICPSGPKGENNEITAYLCPLNLSLNALGLNVFIRFI